MENNHIALNVKYTRMPGGHWRAWNRELKVKTYGITQDEALQKYIDVIVKMGVMTHAEARERLYPISNT